jgi:hypothetical protein
MLVNEDNLLNDEGYKSVRILLRDDPLSRSRISTGRSLSCVFGPVRSATTHRY